MENSKKINVKYVISQTLLFALILVFIMGFKSIFGAINTLIGVTSITAILMFMKVDLTISPLKNFIKLLILNVATGIFAFISMINPWIGIPINFIMVFIINYRLYFNLKDSLYLPFSLQYVFILSAPVTIEELPLRLLSLLVAPVGIMLFQLLVNRNKVSKKGNKIVEDVCKKISEKIDLILNNKSKDEMLNKDLEIKKLSNEFRSIVYDNRQDEFYITEEARIKINILSALEKISLVLNKVKYEEISNEILISLSKCMKRLAVVLEEENNIDELENYIDKILNGYQSIETNDFKILEVLNSLEILKISLSDLRELGKENYNIVKGKDTLEDAKDLYEKYKKSIIKNSVKFSFAVRIAVGVSLAAFITDIFNLSEGKWIMFTMVSVIVPVYEVSIKKGKERIIATLIGCALILGLFTVVKDVGSRSIIILLVGYINNYFTEYRHKMIFNTISAVGSAAMLGNTTVLTINRIFFVAVGVVIAIIINKHIMPRSVENFTKELEFIYLNSIRSMIKKVYLSGIKPDNHGMNNLLIITSLIESKLESDKEFVSENTLKHINKNRSLTLNIHELYVLFNSDKIKCNDTKYIIEDMKALLTYDNHDIKDTITKIENHIKDSKDVINKIILENIREIYLEIHKINKFLA